MAYFHRAFGHPKYGSNGEQLTPIKFTLQHTDYKLVGAYRKFTDDNACNPYLHGAGYNNRCVEDGFLA
jgi:hypothetical protein